MQCISKITIKNPNARKAAADPFIRVDCGRCGSCMKNQANEWSFRLTVEEKNAQSAYFITLTYTNEILQQKHHDWEYPSLDMRDVQLFIKRVRRKQDKQYPKHKKIKYYSVGEYGEDKGRPHYHLIIFNVDATIKNQFAEIWQGGDVHVGHVTRQSINYVTYYIFKKKLNKSLNKELGRINEFAHMSTEIGIDYLINKKYHRENRTFIAFLNGLQCSLPTYYRNKFWNKAELWGINQTYIKQSEDDYKKEILRLKKLKHNNPELELETRKFNKQSKYLNNLKTDKF